MSQQAGGGLLSAPEAERIIGALQSSGVDQVGSHAWRAQHGHITQLNLQAHHNAQTHSDEFVKSALVSLDKFSTLVTDLVTFELSTFTSVMCSTTRLDDSCPRAGCSGALKEQNRGHPPASLPDTLLTASAGSLLTAIGFILSTVLQTADGTAYKSHSLVRHIAHNHPCCPI